MSFDDPEKINNLEVLKRELASNTYQPRFKHRDSFKHINKTEVPDSWADGVAPDPDAPTGKEKFFMKTSVFKNFFLFSIIFFILAVGYAAFVFFTAGNTVSNDNIDISILGNTFTAGGDELSLVLGV